MKIIVTHASAFNFRDALYAPLRNSELNIEHEIYLPQENGKEQMTQEMIKNAGAIIAEVSMPSTGQGIELGWAHIYGIPIICLSEKGSKISSSLQFITDKFIEYENPDDMLVKLKAALGAL